jgi:hypothetical protein
VVVQIEKEACGKENVVKRIRPRGKSRGVI